MHSSPWSHLSQSLLVPEMFIAEQDFITMPLWQQLHLCSPSLPPQTTGILEGLNKTNYTVILHPILKVWWGCRPWWKSTVVTAGTGPCAVCSRQWDEQGAQSTEIKQHILFPATGNIFIDCKISFPSNGCPLSWFSTYGADSLKPCLFYG